MKNEKAIIKSAVFLFICSLFFVMLAFWWKGGFYSFEPVALPNYIMAEGVLYRYEEYSRYDGPAPTEDEIIGTITSTVECSEYPTENGQANFEKFLGQPYAVRDGLLLVKGKDVPSGTVWDGEKYVQRYICAWSYCEPEDGPQ